MANLYGTARDDILSGGKHADRILAYTGDDRLSGLGGTDVLNAGGGNDILVGGFGADHLTGGDGRDRLYGNEGDDTFNGGAGDDFMDGGSGYDVFAGGAGRDTFVVDGRTSGIHDTITDFTPGDTLVLNDFYQTSDEVYMTGMGSYTVVMAWMTGDYNNPENDFPWVPLVEVYGTNNPNALEIGQRGDDAVITLG